MSNTIKKLIIFFNHSFIFKIIFSDKYLEEEENIIAFKKMSSNDPIYKILSTHISTR